MPKVNNVHHPPVSTNIKVRMTEATHYGVGNAIGNLTTKCAMITKLLMEIHVTKIVLLTALLRTKTTVNLPSMAEEE